MLEERWWPARTLSQDEYWLVVRVGRFKAWLLAREERCLALVGHKGFLQCFTAGAAVPKGRRLGNCEALWVARAVTSHGRRRVRAPTKTESRRD